MDSPRPNPPVASGHGTNVSSCVSKPRFPSDSSIAAASTTSQSGGDSVAPLRTFHDIMTPTTERAAPASAPAHRASVPSAAGATSLARAQSFIAVKFARPTFYRVEHGRLTGAHAKFQWSHPCHRSCSSWLRGRMGLLGSGTHATCAPHPMLSVAEAQQLSGCSRVTCLLLCWLPSRNAELWFTQPRFYAQFIMFFAVAAVDAHWLAAPPSHAVVGGDCAVFLGCTYLAFRATIAVKYVVVVH